MKMKLLPVADDASAHRYTKCCLDGGNSLSRAVSLVFEKWSCRYFIFLENGNVGQSDYRWGGVCKSIDATPEMAALLYEEMFSRNRVVIFEHGLAKKNDDFLDKLDLSPVFYENEVYFVCDKTCSSQSLVERLISVSLTAQGFSAFVALRGEVNVSDDQGLQSLGQIADSVSLLVIGAHDNETFLVCRRV